MAKFNNPDPDNEWLKRIRASAEEVEAESLKVAPLVDAIVESANRPRRPGSDDFYSAAGVLEDDSLLPERVARGLLQIGAVLALGLTALIGGLLWVFSNPVEVPSRYAASFLVLVSGAAVVSAVIGAMVLLWNAFVTQRARAIIDRSRRCEAIATLEQEQEHREELVDAIRQISSTNRQWREELLAALRGLGASSYALFLFGDEESGDV